MGAILTLRYLELVFYVGFVLFSLLFTILNNTKPAQNKTFNEYTILITTTNIYDIYT